jgi:sugar phosphate isomerase/epimerase
VPGPHVHIPFSRLGEFSAVIAAQRLSLEIYVSAKDLDCLDSGWLEKTQGIVEQVPSLSVHGPFMDLSPGGVDKRVRAVTTERFEKAIDMAGALGAKAAVFHSGYEKWRFAHRADIWLENSLTTWPPLIEKASKRGVKIAVENIFEDTPDNLAALMQRLGSAHFGICFDTGHFNLFSKQRTLKDWLLPLKEHIIEVHLHDNDGTFDQHRPIGNGNFRFRELFEEIKGLDVILTLEAHSREDLFLSMERLRAFLPDSEA